MCAVFAQGNRTRVRCLFARAECSLYHQQCFKIFDIQIIKNSIKLPKSEYPIRCYERVNNNFKSKIKTSTHTRKRRKSQSTQYHKYPPNILYLYYVCSRCWDTYRRIYCGDILASHDMMLISDVWEVAKKPYHLRDRFFKPDATICVALCFFDTEGASIRVASRSKN